MSTHAADARRVLDRCDVLARYSEEPERLTRRFATPALRLATDDVAAWMRAAGMDTRRDNVGNLIGRYDASANQAARALLLGSHLDTVRDAGKYDGPLGVLTALALVERLHARGERLPFALEVVAFADEEGLRYGTAYLGSKAMAGAFERAYLDRTDGEGVRMAEAIRGYGGDPAAIPWDARQRDDLLGYCEVHIEQGPVLEAAGLPIGVVSAIAGQSRLAAAFSGRAGHAGTVPMTSRRDALCAGAAFVLAVEELARERAGIVATVGQLEVSPGAGNVIPGRVDLSLDVRHQVDAARAEAVRALRELAWAIGTERGIGVDWQVLQETPAVACAAGLTALLARAVDARGYEACPLVSGAGHDAVVLAALCPVAMLFVRCKDGISHHPAESVAVEDVAVALDVLERFAVSLAAEYGAG